LSGNINDIYGIYDQGDFSSQDLFEITDEAIDFSINDYRRIYIIRAEGQYVGGRAETGFGLEEIQTDEGLVEISIDKIDIPNKYSLLEPRTQMVLRHELGHSLGARHAGSYNCGQYNPIDNNCPMHPYGDILDTMADGPDFHMNAALKERLGWKDANSNLGWFDPSNIVEINSDLDYGTFTLEPLEVVTNGIQVLKIPSYGYEFEGEIGLAEVVYYTVEFRDQIGFDSGIWEPYVVLHAKALDKSTDPLVYESGNSLLLTSYVEDIPGTWIERGVSMMKEGEEFLDVNSGFRLFVDDIESGYAIVTVSPSSVCGNGIKESGEECDGNGVRPESCQDWGYPGGNVVCSDECTIDFSGCVTLCEDQGHQCRNDGCNQDAVPELEGQCKEVYGSEFQCCVRTTPLTCDELGGDCTDIDCGSAALADYPEACLDIGQSGYCCPA
jgi:hypothetical protein